MEAIFRRRAILEPTPRVVQPQPVHGHGMSAASVTSLAAQTLSYREEEGEPKKSSIWLDKLFDRDPDDKDASIASSRAAMSDLVLASHSTPPLASNGRQTPSPSRPSTVPPLAPHLAGHTPGKKNLTNSRVAELMPRSIDMPGFMPEAQSARQPNTSRPTSVQSSMDDSNLAEDGDILGASYPSDHQRQHHRSQESTASTAAGHTRAWPASQSPEGSRLPIKTNTLMPPKRSSRVAGSINARQQSRRSRSTRRHSESSEAGSSTFSATRPSRNWSWSSASSSGEDPVTYRNARHFPPRLPAAPARQFSALRNRPAAANQIASWVSHYEKSQSPKRVRLANMSPSTLSGATESGEDDSEDFRTPSYLEIEMMWQQLKEKRKQVVELRNDMAERRMGLRELRHKKDEADNDFMNILRPMLVNHAGLPRTSASLLNERMARMQSLRDDYHFRESTYESLETVLDEEESDLSSLETKFFSLLAAGQTSDREDSPTFDGSDTATSSYSSDTPYALLGISRDGPAEDLHPLYIELRSALGDLENAKEDLEDLLFVKNQYDYDVELKASMGLKTTDDVQEFLAEFPMEEKDMKASVAQLQDNVKRLKKLCEEKQVMRKHLSIRMEYALDPTIKYEDMDLEDKTSILASRKSLAHHSFPELLSQPDHVLSTPIPLTTLAALRNTSTLPDTDPAKRGRHWLASKEHSIERLLQDHSAGGRADFVNRWLLQQLRLSPLNAKLLYSTFVTSRSLKIRDTWRWQCDVLHYWWRDSTTALTEGAYDRVSSDNESEYSSRLGTPQMSTAASEGERGGWARGKGAHGRERRGDARSARW